MLYLQHLIPRPFWLLKCDSERARDGERHTSPRVRAKNDTAKKTNQIRTERARKKTEKAHKRESERERERVYLSQTTHCSPYLICSLHAPPPSPPFPRGAFITYRYIPYFPPQPLSLCHFSAAPPGVADSAVEETDLSAGTTRSHNPHPRHRPPSRWGHGRPGERLLCNQAHYLHGVVRSIKMSRGEFFLLNDTETQPCFG